MLQAATCRIRDSTGSLVRGGSPREIEPAVAAEPGRAGYFTGRGGGKFVHLTLALSPSDAERENAKAKAQTDKDYEETAAAVAEKQALTAAEEAELNRLWRKLVKLYHPDRFAHEPDKLATYEKLTAAINRAKEAGDIQTLREIAEDPAGYILRQGWTGLDFSDSPREIGGAARGGVEGVISRGEVELAELRRLRESLHLEIIAVIESLEQLKESAEYELCGIAEQRPGVLDELAEERTKLLEQDSAELQQEAEKLAEEIRELSGEELSRIQ
ncbi:MAG: J domain-containing protein [Verrucomicrobiota bacterium]|nr:J domain-containing protein [Verrucomicrobiota bacterium]